MDQVFTIHMHKRVRQSEGGEKGERGGGGEEERQGGREQRGGTRPFQYILHRKTLTVSLLNSCRPTMKYIIHAIVTCKLQNM